MSNNDIDDDNINLFGDAARIPSKKEKKKQEFVELYDRLDCVQRALAETRGQMEEMRREMRMWLTRRMI